MAGMNDKAWTPEEEQQLLDLANAGYSKIAIAEALGRTENSINSKYGRLTKDNEHETRVRKDKKHESGNRKDGWRPDKNRYEMIDGEKLRSLLKEKGFGIIRAGEELGVLGNTFANWTKNNYCPKWLPTVIESKFDIKLDDYIKKEPKPESAKETVNNIYDNIYDVVLAESMKTDLYKIIYAAVYEGVKQALRDSHA